MVFGDDNWGSVNRQGKSWKVKPPKPPKGGGGKKGGGGLCVQIAPFAAWPALLSLAGAIAASLIG